MAKYTREYHKCDICGAEIEKPYNGGEMGTYKLTADTDYAIAGHKMIWSELCEPCNDWLGRYIDELKQGKSARFVARAMKPEA